MKTFILTLILIISVIEIQAQECVVLFPPGVPVIPDATYGDPVTLAKSAPAFVRTLYIAAHVVRSTSGTGGISTSNLLLAITQLNTAYESAYIRFELSETDYIDNNSYTNLTGTVFTQLAQINVQPNKLNIYFVPTSSTLNGIAYIRYNRCAVTNSAAINSSTLAHEVGHNLYLYHTHSDAVNPPNDCTPVTPLELVNGTDCDFAGDFLCDTPAEPFNCGNGISGYVNSTNCTYTGTFTDPNNQAYTPDVHNYMGYSTPGCRNHFSQMQVSKMHQTLISSLSYLITEAVTLSNRVNGNNIPHTSDKPSTLTALAAGTVNSGTSLYLLDGYDYQIKTNQERFPAYLSFGNLKHNNWNNDFTQFKLTETYPLRRATHTSLYQDANFVSTDYSKIQAELEGAIWTNLGAFNFNDPWYVKSDGTQPGNYWISCTSIYEPNGKEGATEKGVFLNQNPDNSDPNKPYYSVQAQQTQIIPINGINRTFNFQNWSTNTPTSASLQNANALETGVVFKEPNAIVTANYKGLLLSNNSAGFSSNSQRKFISDVNGNKHLVYESQGSVWYTRSTNNGSTWQQEVKLNEDGTQAKGATMAASSDEYLYVLYQCDRGLGINTNPTLVLSQYYYGTLRWQEEVCELSSYAFNTTPTISAVSGVVLVVYRPNATGGLVGKEYWLSSGNITLIYDRIIPGTTQSSVNPSLATTVLSQPTKHMLVYQESYYGIYYKQWTVATDFANLVTSNLTSGVGYSLNYTPSIVDVTTGSRLCWVGSNYSGTSKQVVFRDPENLYQFWTFGNSVASPSINKTDANTAYFIGWSDGNGTSFKIVDSHLSYAYIKTLTGLQGSAMQLSNGSGANTMYAMTFYNGGLPYPLTQSNSLASYYSMSKENSNSNIASGRAGIVMKGEGEFSFMLGDIEVNSEKIRFKKLSDTLTIPSKDVFNTLVESEPFELKENSSFTYSVEYGVTDSAIAAQVLQNGENVKFKVELVDAVTNQIINTFDNVTYTKDFLQKYNSLAYQVNTEAIGTMNVKLRLVADHSGDANYLINNSFVEDEIIAKKGFKVINLKNELQIKDYALAQNYPNPFNPATTITYQLPKSGSVTLKIFDILGNEVKTLVDEHKEMGRYTVQFDASSLASGMYVYQLRANDYTSTKKMMLLK